MTTDAVRTGPWLRIQQATFERFHIRLESVVVLFGLAAIMAVLSPCFLSIGNILNILLATATIGILAIGATFEICSGGIDLSLGSVMRLSGVVGASLAVNWGTPSSLAIVARLLAGMIAGFISGILITRA
jgi:ribose transport system permease protein